MFAAAADHLTRCRTDRPTVRRCAEEDQSARLRSSRNPREKIDSASRGNGEVAIGQAGWLAVAALAGRARAREGVERR